MNWQPIETAPKDGTLVILFWPWWSSQSVTGYFSGGDWQSEHKVLEDRLVADTHAKLGGVLDTTAPSAEFYKPPEVNDG